MKQDVSWGLKNVLLPLSPFLIGAILRWLYEGAFSLSILDSVSLSFSMAILCILLLKSASQLEDKDLNDSLTSVLGVGIIFYLALFATAIFIQIHIEHQTIESLKSISALIANSQVEGLESSIYNREQDIFIAIQKRMSVFIIILTVITIPLTLVSRRRYNLK